MKRAINPPGIAAPVANYAHAVLSSGTKMLHTSGVVPVRPDGTTPRKVGEQAQVVWENIAAMLAEASMESSDIVSVVTYAVLGHDLDQIMASRDAFLGDHRAASTLVTVPALARSQWKVEIAVVAVA